MPDIGSDEPVVQSVLAAARSSQLAAKKAMRDLVAKELDSGVPPRDLASLTKRLSDLVDEIEQLEAASEEEKPNARKRSSRKFRPEAI